MAAATGVRTPLRILRKLDNDENRNIREEARATLTWRFLVSIQEVKALINTEEVDLSKAIEVFHALSTETLKKILNKSKTTHVYDEAYKQLSFRKRIGEIGP